MARGDMKALVEGTTRRRLVDFALWHRINERKNEAGVGQQETVTGEMQHHSQDAKADLGQKQLVASQALGVSPSAAIFRGCLLAIQDSFLMGRR